MSNARGSRLLETIWHDLRYALRTVTKSWGFTALAVGSLGIGLGANTALFSLVDALLLRSLPVSDPAGLVLVQRIVVKRQGRADRCPIARRHPRAYVDLSRCSAVDGAAVRDGHNRPPAGTGSPGVHGNRRLLLDARRRGSSGTTVRRRTRRDHQRSPLELAVQTRSQRSWPADCRERRRLPYRRGRAARVPWPFARQCRRHLAVAATVSRVSPLSDRATRAGRLDRTRRGCDRRAAQRS